MTPLHIFSTASTALTALTAARPSRRTLRQPESRHDRWRVVGLIVVLAGGAVGVGHAADKPGTIYTCTDAQGRRITSDRPIAECMDRNQYELNPSGTIKRTIPPVPTADERAQQEAKRRAEAEALARQQEDQRREQALLHRYPTPADHDAARAAALAQVDDVVVVINRRLQELAQQAKGLAAEMEFYQRDPAKAPEVLKRRQQENQNQRDAQLRYLADQEKEKTRINARFDSELLVLKRLWAEAPAR